MVRACPSEFNPAMERSSQLLMLHLPIGVLASPSPATFNSKWFIQIIQNIHIAGSVLDLCLARLIFSVVSSLYVTINVFVSGCGSEFFGEAHQICRSKWLDHNATLTYKHSHVFLFINLTLLPYFIFSTGKESIKKLIFFLLLQGYCYVLIITLIIVMIIPSRQESIRIRYNASYLHPPIKYHPHGLIPSYFTFWKIELYGFTFKTLIYTLQSNITPHHIYFK